jgi:hypothetical protein
MLEDCRLQFCCTMRKFPCLLSGSFLRSEERRKLSRARQVSTLSFGGADIGQRDLSLPVGSTSVGCRCSGSCCGFRSRRLPVANSRPQRRVLRVILCERVFSLDRSSRCPRLPSQSSQRTTPLEGAGKRNPTLLHTLGCLCGGCFGGCAGRFRRRAMCGKVAVDHLIAHNALHIFAGLSERD